MNHRTAFGDTPATRCRFYRRVCDLPAVVDPPHLGRIIMRATHVWAVTMPAPLGRAVRIEMAARHNETGPILVHPRSNRWSFLVRPDIPDDVRLFAEMFRFDVSIIRSGGTIALPSPTDLDTHLRQWVEPPRCPFRPSGHTVTQAIRTVTGHPPHRTSWGSCQITE